MPITFVGSKTFSSDGSPVGTFNVSLTDLKDTSNNNATLQEDDFVLIGYTVGSTVDESLTAPSGWVEDAEVYSNNTADINLATWRKFMGASPDTSVDLPSPGTTSRRVVGTIFAFRGVDTSNPLDVSVTTSTSSTGSNPDPSSITPTTDGTLIVVIGSGATSTSGSAYSQPTDLSSTTNHWRSLINVAANFSGLGAVVGCGIKTDWTSGAFDPTAWSGGPTGGSLAGAAVTYALRPAPTGPDPLTADQQSYTFTGQTVNLSRTREVAATKQTYTLSSIANSIRKGSKLLATKQNYNLTGIDVNLVAVGKLVADLRAFTISGPTGNRLLYGHRLAASTRTYTLTGPAGNRVLRGYPLTATTRSYSVTGIQNSLKVARRSVATKQTYSLTGIDVALDTGKRLSITSRSYALSGVAINFRAARYLSATRRTYALTGITVQLDRVRLLLADSRAFTVGQNDTRLIADISLETETQTYELSFSETPLLKSTGAGRIQVIIF